MESAIEKTKNLLLDQITGPSSDNDKKLTQMKRVRMSFVEPLPTGESDQGLRVPNANGRETLGEYLRRNSSSLSISSASSSRRTSIIPDFLLKTLNDKKLLMKHVSFSIFTFAIFWHVWFFSECKLGRNRNHKPRARSRLKLIAARREPFSLCGILVPWI